MYDVVALGELLIDFTTQSIDSDGYPTMAAHPGGAPANFLAAIAKFGGKAGMLGKVGTDTFGKLLTNTLRGAGIETKGLVAADDVFTTLAFVTLDENGDREFAFARKPGADTQLTFDELDLSLIDETRVFHFGTLSLTDEPARTTTYRAVEYAKTHGKLVTYDPNLRKPLWNDLNEAKEQMLWGLRQADVVKISDEEAPRVAGCLTGCPAADPGGLCRELLDRRENLEMVILTEGAEGSRVFTRNRISAYVIPRGERVRPVDTVGAGDSFTAAFCAMLAAGYDIWPAQAFASKVAAFVCSCAGATPEYPAAAKTEFSGNL